MASPALLLAHHLGLDIYDTQSAELAVQTLLQIRQVFSSTQSALVGQAAIVHYVGNDQKAVEAKLDLMIALNSPKLIHRHFGTDAKSFHVSVPCGNITLNCIGTNDDMERAVIAAAPITNLAGTLIRTASLGSLIAMKFAAGGEQDHQDVDILLAANRDRVDRRQNIETARNLLQMRSAAVSEAFKSYLTNRQPSD